MAQSPQLDSPGVVRLTVRSNGSPIAETIQVVSISVDKAVGEIPRATLVLLDGDLASGKFPASDAGTFAPGGEIEILAGYGRSEAAIFKGIVTGHGLRISGENDSRLVIECRDRAVAMTLGRRDARHGGSTDGEIIARLISGHGGLAHEVAATATRHGELVQVRSSDWDFLRSRAAVNGLLVRVDDGKVTVKPPLLDATPRLEVTYGQDLREFSAELDPGEQWSRVDGSGAGLPRIRGRMKFQGSAMVKPGDLVELAGLGTRFNGKVFVGAVRHEIGDGDWTTGVEFGLSPDWFAVPGDPPGPSSGMDGLQIGVVKRLDGDPEGKCRIQVSVPRLPGETDGIWARLASFYASDAVGAFFVPEVGDEVLLGYLDGDPARPVVLGSLHGNRKPPHELTAENSTKALITRGRLEIAFDDARKAITLGTPGGNKVVLSDDDGSILLQDRNGNKVELGGDGIALDSPKDIRITAKGRITIDAVAGIAMASKADVAVAGLNVSHSAGAAFVARGSVSAELSASGQTTVKGAVVMIN